MSETIKVVIRFKGREELEDIEKDDTDKQTLAKSKSAASNISSDNKNMGKKVNKEKKTPTAELQQYRP